MARCDRVEHHAHRIYEAAINVLALPGMEDGTIELVSGWLQDEANRTMDEIEKEFTLRLKALIEEIDMYNRGY